MVHDDDPFTLEEQTQAEAIDHLIDAHLREQPLLPPDQRGASDLLLIRELSRFYQRQAEEIQTSLQRARQRVEQRSTPSFASRQRKRTPLTRLSSPRERRDAMNHPWSFFRATQGSSRLAGLVAGLLLAILIGGLITGLILVRAHGSPTAHPTLPTATLAPGATHIPTQPVPTQTPGSVPGIQGLVSIKMLDATNGWAITGQNHILRTTDGANRWQDVTPPSIDPPQGYSNLTSDFLSPSVAWVYSFVRDANDTGGTTKYYRTTNGGQLWLSQINQGDIPGQIVFTDSKDGWMFSGYGEALGAEWADVFRTTDGGASWTKEAGSVSPRTPYQPGQLPYGGIIYSGMGARDAMTAWVTGSGSTPSNGSTPSYLYVTRDGGQTFQPQTLPLPSSFSGQVVTSPPTFFNAQDGMLPVLLTGASPEAGAAYVTHDGGATWQSTPLIEAGGFDFINANQGWATNGAATAGSTLYATSDGGQHWTKLPATPNFYDIDVLNFVSAQIGWAISIPQTGNTATLLKTTDGGNTWTAVPSPPS